MKNILYVLEDLKIGGIEKVVENILMYLKNEKEINISIVCLTGGGKTADKLINSGIEIKIFDFKNNNFLKNILNFRKYIVEKKIDIIHTHNHSAGVYGRLAGLNLGLKIYHHVHNLRDYSFKILLKEKMLSLFTKKIFCCSSSVQNFVINKYLVSKIKTEILYNPVDLSKVDYFKKNYSGKLRKIVNNNLPILCIIGNLFGHKGQYKFLSTFKELLNKLEINLVLIGKGDDENKIKEYMIKNKLEKYLFLAGEVPEPFELINDIDILLIPSLSEGLGLSAIEAMAFSKPIIANETGGLSEVVADHKSGFLIDIFNINELYPKVNLLLNDKYLFQHFSEKARQISQEKFNIENIIGQLKKHYLNE